MRANVCGIKTEYEKYRGMCSVLIPEMKISDVYTHENVNDKYVPKTQLKRAYLLFHFLRVSGVWCMDMGYLRVPPVVYRLSRYRKYVQYATVCVCVFVCCGAMRCLCGDGSICIFFFVFFLFSYMWDRGNGFISPQRTVSCCSIHVRRFPLYMISANCDYVNIYQV